MFAEELIAAYPDAKVILVERPFAAWRASIAETIAVTFNPLNAVIALLEPQMMGTAVELFSAAYRVLFKGKDRAEVEANLEREYQAYYERVKRVTPKERLLVYRVEEGWEPLCRFLGRKVPEEEFPRLNERGAVLEAERSMQWESGKRIVRNVAVVGGLVVAGWWLFV